MKVTLKPVRELVLVITGASSGAGLATAELAAVCAVALLDRAGIFGGGD